MDLIKDVQVETNVWILNKMFLLNKCQSVVKFHAFYVFAASLRYCNIRRTLHDSVASCLVDTKCKSMRGKFAKNRDNYDELYYWFFKGSTRVAFERNHEKNKKEIHEENIYANLHSFRLNFSSHWATSHTCFDSTVDRIGKMIFVCLFSCMLPFSVTFLFSRLSLIIKLKRIANDNAHNKCKCVKEWRYFREIDRRDEQIRYSWEVNWKELRKETASPEMGCTMRV